MNLDTTTSRIGEYELNDCGVVLNTTQIWYFMLDEKKSLAWCYWRIGIGLTKNGLWDYSHWTAGGCGPCSFGRWKTKEEVTEAAIEYMHSKLSKPYENNLCPKKDYFAAQEAWNDFYYTRLINTDNIDLSKVQLPKDGIQTSLF